MINVILLLGFISFFFGMVMLARQMSSWHANCWMGWHKWLDTHVEMPGIPRSEQKWCPYCGKTKRTQYEVREKYEG